MCGIVGAIAERNVVPVLLEGLRRLEYRGYDSAGLAITTANGLGRVRAVGKVNALAQKLDASPLSGSVGIAHTRWATHGKPTEANAHPHQMGDIVLVHNGIIENYAELKADFLADGAVFESETDTEVIAHLIAQAYEKQKDLLKAVHEVLAKLQGAYGLVVMCKQEPGRLIGVRSGSPLVVGIGIEEHFIASDTLSLMPVTNRFVYLEEGDIVDMQQQAFQVYAADMTPVTRAIDQQELCEDSGSKGGYKHFMLKEIMEQTQVVARTLQPGIASDDTVDLTAFGVKAATIFPQVERVRIVACGTSYHAGMAAKYWLESWAGVGCDVEVASELRYRKAVVSPNTLLLTISQSGETADSLAALRQAQSQQYLASLAICNVASSSLVRESDCVFLTQAGPEIGVASTKAFSTQLVALMLFTLGLMQAQGVAVSEIQEKIKVLQTLPSYIDAILALDKPIAMMAEHFVEKHHALFLGRGIHYPMALEGALKLKEISYIHAEAYPAGELKHGPLALVDSEMPVIAIAPDNQLLDKLKANLQEVKARGGELFIFTAEQLQSQFADDGHIVQLPHVDEMLEAVVYTIPLQLLAYHVAVLKGTDVDQPRNLAKSVTVE